jgi:hypothetical protein
MDTTTNSSSSSSRNNNNNNIKKQRLNFSNMWLYTWKHNKLQKNDWTYHVERIEPHHISR